MSGAGMRDIGKLVMMAEQIARNLASQGEAAAIAGTAGHIRDFWDPRMKAAILAADGTCFSPILAAALERLRKGSS